MTSTTTHKSHLTIQYFSCIPELILVIAIGLGMYTLSSVTDDNTILIIAIIGAVLLAFCALLYHFGQEDLSKAIFHIWIGCFLGILAFTKDPQLQYVTLEEVMEAMLIVSMVLGWCWSILECLRPSEAKLLTVSEGLESLGLIIPNLVTGVDSIALTLITLAFIFHISAMRLKSLMGLGSFLAFIIVGVFLFLPALEVKPNIYVVICFVGRHAFRSLIDFHFCGLSMIDRWRRSLFGKAKFIRYLFVIYIFIMEIVMTVIIGIGTLRHKEWYIVLPLYIILAIVGLMFHFMSFVTCWKLMGKITECNASADDRCSFNRIMAAKGLRYFGLVSQRIIYLSFVFTIVIFVVGFETRTPCTLAMLFLVLPMEATFVSLFWELGDNLGGTCTGYAIVAPVTSLKQGKTAQLLTSSDVMEISKRGTLVLNELQHLFNYHMIENFGCDYSSSGFELESLQNKVGDKYYFVNTETLVSVVWGLSERRSFPNLKLYQGLIPAVGGLEANRLAQIFDNSTTVPSIQKAMANY